jgi:RNA polymerase-binding transcription factor DksA
VRQWLQRERDRATRAGDRAAAEADERLRRREVRDPCAYLSPAAAREERDLVEHSGRARANLQHLQQIEEALRRLEDEPERFGICAVCQEPITMARLEVIPHARACGSCANRSAI